MLTYKAMYKYLDRRLLASALVDMAETNLLHGESLPIPDPACTDIDADLEEPIHLQAEVQTDTN